MTHIWFYFPFFLKCLVLVCILFSKREEKSAFRLEDATKRQLEAVATKVIVKSLLGLLQWMMSDVTSVLVSWLKARMNISEIFVQNQSINEQMLLMLHNTGRKLFCFENRKKGLECLAEYFIVHTSRKSETDIQCFYTWKNGWILIECPNECPNQGLLWILTILCKFLKEL